MVIEGQSTDLQTTLIHELGKLPCTIHGPAGENMRSWELEV